MNTEHEYPPQGTFTRDELEEQRRQRSREIARSMATAEAKEFRADQRETFRRLSQGKHAGR